MSGDGGDIPAAPALLIDLSVNALAVGEEPIDNEEEDQEHTGELLVDFSERSIPSAGQLAVGEEPIDKEEEGQEQTGVLLVDFTERSMPLDRGESSFSFVQCPQDTIASDIKDSMCISVEGKTADTSSSPSAFEEAAVNSAPTPNNAVSESLVGEIFTTEKKDETVQAVSLVEASSSVTSVFSQNSLIGNDGIAQNSVTASAILSSTVTSNPTQKESGEGTSKIVTKNPFDSFGDYVVNFFQRTVVYEEELELRQSQRRPQLNSTFHGSSRRNIHISTEFAEGQASTSTADTTIDVKLNKANGLTTPELEALATVEAISGFRDVSEVKKQLKAEHSFYVVDENQTKKKMRNADEAQIETEASTKQQAENWAIFFREKNKIKFNEAAIESLVLPLSVDEFYNHVLADDSNHSFNKFMCDIGELDVDITPWDLPSASTTWAASESLSRTIHYTHPVNAPMAPPTAKARKQQILHKFSNAGLCLETCTIVEEVPMADCFVVEDRLWVHGAKDGSEGCVLSVTFQIRFVKGTLFRRIIENTTRREYAIFWDQFADMVRGLGENSRKAGIGLEDAAAIIEEEGHEMPLSSAMSCIRRLSRRLSIVTKPPSTREGLHLEGVEEERGIGIYVERMVNFVLDGVRYIRKEVSGNDSAFVVVCAVFFLMMTLNIGAMRQMMMLGRSLREMNARLEKIDLNQAILLKLWNDKILDETCSS